MKKFSNYEYKPKSETNIEDYLDLLLKENITLEISGEEKPWTSEIEIKTNEEIISNLKDYIEQETLKANLIILEGIKIAYYKNELLNTVDNEIEIIRKKIK